MCPGNEHMTPPAILVYLKSGKGIEKTWDEGTQRHKDWLIRVVPNLYPALCPPQKESDVAETEESNLLRGVGHHEVLIESPKHEENPAVARTEQLIYVINAYIDRLRELSAKPYVRYVSIFRNHGLEAGASLSHAHSQIIATPTVPEIPEGERESARNFWKQKKKCVFCDIIEKEMECQRLILKNSRFVAFAPFASVNPMEFWIFPRKHQNSIMEMRDTEIKTFSETLKDCLNRLRCLVNDPPYNYGFHLTTDQESRDWYHWHLEVYPRLAIWAGFEKSTGMYINTITPENAADSLRKAVST